MALITLPSGGIKSIEWTQPEWGGFVVRSGWTAQQTAGDTGTIRAGWKCKITLTDRKVASLTPWRAFFAQARGPLGKFAVYMTEGQQLPVIAFGTQVDTGAATGAANIVNLRGLPASMTARKAGQLIEIVLNSEQWQAFVLIQDLVSNAYGGAAATLYPPPRYAFPDAAGVEMNSPAVVMRLTTPTGGWSVSPGQIYSPTSFECEEVLP